MIESTFRVPREAIEPLAKASISAVFVYLRFCSLQEGPGEPTEVSSSKLATLTDMTQRTVFGALAQLEQLGLIRRERAMATGVNRYRVIVSGDRVVSAAPPDEANAMLQADPGPDDTPAPDVIPVEPAAEVPKRDGANQSDKVMPLDDFIAAVYSPKCQVGDVQHLLNVDEVELRRCLEWLNAEGGVSADMPVGFFVGCLRVARDKLTGCGPP